MKKILLLILLLSSVKLYAQDIVQLKITNSVMRTNKLIPCKAFVNTKDIILTMVAINNNQSFKLTYQGNSIYTIYFYDNNKLEATKTIYRRRDLEETKSKQIYTSRTGEITITISND